MVFGHRISCFKGLKSIQKKAEVANIDPICISVKPKSLAKGGIVIKITDCPAPTHNKPAAKIQMVLGNLLISLLISHDQHMNLIILAIMH